MTSERAHTRFPIAYRIEHWLLTASFTTLAVTGLVQKFHAAAFSQWFIALLGGVENIRVVHRFAAAIMMLEAVYHIAVVAYRVLVVRVRPVMLPGVGDARAALQAVLFNLGLSRERPLEGRYNFAEKAEYWALVWGTVVMAVTGFMLWNPIATARFLPGDVIPAAKAAHGAEAVLAAAAIVIWHFYHVHVKLFNKSMFSGKLSEREMAHEHPLELAEIKSGVADRPVDPVAIKRRRQWFVPVSLLIALGLVVGLFFFMTFEETALATVPPVESRAEVFVPLTPTPFPTPLPTPTPAPVAALVWEGGLAELVGARCGACHGSAQQLGDLDATSLVALMVGGENGPAVVPGDPNSSLLILRQATGDHPGQFSGEELALLRQWIEAGAPEK